MCNFVIRVTRYKLEKCKTFQKLTERFVFFFVCGLSSLSIIFHSYGDVIITGEGLQIFALFWTLMAIGQ